MWLLRESPGESFAVGNSRSAFLSALYPQRPNNAGLELPNALGYNADEPGDRMHWIGVLLVVGLLTMTAHTQKTQRIATGMWGGPHITMDVDSRLARIEFDCATGAIEGPLVVDSEGKFHLRGSFTPQRGGPVRADETPQSQPAIYTGEIKGNAMTLTLKVSDSDDSETFTLEKGKAGELFKCK